MTKLFLLAFVGILSISSFATDIREESAEELYKKGAQSLGESNREDAMFYYYKASQKGLPIAANDLGSLLEVDGDIESALYFYEIGMKAGNPLSQKNFERLNQESLEEERRSSKSHSPLLQRETITIEILNRMNPQNILEWGIHKEEITPEIRFALISLGKQLESSD